MTRLSPLAAPVLITPSAAGSRLLPTDPPVTVSTRPARTRAA